MTKLNSFLLGTLTTTLLVAIVTLINIEPEDWDWRVDPIEYKFGTPPNNNATLEPIVHLLNEEKRAFCTAFIIDAHYAITAGHCLKQDGDLTKRKLGFSDADGINLNIEVTAKGFFTDQDFGLLTGNFSAFKSIATDFHHNGFAVKKLFTTCGYSLGQNYLSCNAFIPINNYNFLIRGNGYLVKGMSGGPVIDTETGIVVGVNTATTDGYIYVTPLQGFLGFFKLD